MSVKTKAEILADINANFADTPPANITAAELRNVCTDIVDTMATGTPIYVSSGTPGGPNRSIQFNNSSTFGGDPNFIITSTSGLIVPTSGQFGGHITLLNSSGLRLIANSNVVSILPPTGLSATYNFRVPINAGSNGQVLATDGNGNLTWVNQSGGAGGGTGIPGGGDRQIQFNSNGVFSGLSGFVITSTTGLGLKNSSPVALDLAVGAGDFANSAISLVNTYGTGITGVVIKGNNNVNLSVINKNNVRFNIGEGFYAAAVGFNVSGAGAFYHFGVNGSYQWYMDSTTLSPSTADRISDLGSASFRVNHGYFARVAAGVGVSPNCHIDVESTGATTGIYAIAAVNQGEDLLNLRCNDATNSFCVSPSGLVTSRAGVSLSSQIRHGGTLKSSFATVVSPTSASDLLSYSISSGTLQVGSYLTINAWGNFVAPTSTRFRVFYGATQLIQLLPAGTPSGVFDFKAVIGASGISTQKVLLHLTPQTGVDVLSSSAVSNTNGTGIFRIEVSGSAGGEYILEGYKIEWQPSNP